MRPAIEPRGFGWRAARWVVATATLLAMMACAGSGGGSATLSPGPTIQVWVTTADQSRLLARDGDLQFGSAASLPLVIDIDASQRYQEFLGIGAAFTDATALLFANNLSATARNDLLHELFGPAPGLGLSLMRVPIGASDFSTSQYSLDDVPAGQSDPALAHFNLGPDSLRALALVQSAQAINPALRVIGSPWSAPAWMKDSGSLINGQLLPQYYDAFADYLVRFAEAYRVAGVPLYAITVQNEPGFEPADYPGMRFNPADRAVFVGQHLGPRLAQLAVPPRLFEYDHNWDLPSSPLQVLADPLASQYLAGVAWHCYAGQVTAQTPVHDAYPAMAVIMSECSGGGWNPAWADGLSWFAGTLLIDGARNWGQGTVLWNLALDENNGPHLGGCTDCRGVVTIDSVTGTVTRNVEYYSLAHLGRFVRPGALRIASAGGPADLHHAAYRNADDGSLALLVYNGATQARRFTIRFEQRTAVYELPAGSVATLLWQP